MPATQQTLPIEDIRDNLIFLKDGGVSLLLETTAVNFGLLSLEEQMAVIGSFAGMLNSLSFPIQIVVRSKKLDITSYLLKINLAKEHQPNPLLSVMIDHYYHFIENITKNMEVLDKQFYICLNITAVELGVLPQSPSAKLKKAQNILLPRRDHIARQLLRIGLKAKQLPTAELIGLFYDIYNPPAPTITSAYPIPPQSPKTTPPPPPSSPLPQAPISPIPQPTKQPNPTINLTSPFVVEELNDEYATH